MKHLFLCLLLLAAPALRAQANFSILHDLEGRWYQEGRQQATYSEWHFSDDQTLVHQVFSVKCGVTVLLSHAVLHFNQHSATLLGWSDSLYATTPQIYRLLQADADQIIFQNEDTTAQTQQLAWQFSPQGYLMARTNHVETQFHRRAKQEAKKSLLLHFGANVSIMANRDLARDARHYRKGAGLDLSLGFGLHNQGRVGANFELGLSQRQIGVSARWLDGDLAVSRNGMYRNVDFYLAFMPEIAIGKARRFTLSAGLFGTLGRINRFEGSSRAFGWNPELKNPDFDLSKEHGALAGLAWQLPKKLLPIGQPEIYCRGAWGLGKNKVRAVSVGLGFRLK